MDNRELFDVHGNSDALARARMQIDNHNYEVYTNNDLIAIHKPRSTFYSRDYYFSLLPRLRADRDRLHEIVFFLNSRGTNLTNNECYHECVDGIQCGNNILRILKKYLNHIDIYLILY